MIARPATLHYVQNGKFRSPTNVPGAACNPCNVVQFQRRPHRGAFSVERLFEDVRSALPDDIVVTLLVNRFLSRGVLGRVYDTLRARWFCGDVNHVLGDVHYLMLLLPRKRTVLTVLDCVSLRRLHGFRRWLFWVIWYRLPLQRAACLTVISEFTRKSILELGCCPAERIHVIPPPISSEFLPSPMQPRLGRFRVLQIGTTLNKNVARVTEALSGLPVVFVVVGVLSNADRSKLAEVGIDYENHVGLSRSQVVDQYRRADVVIFASTYEGFGMPIVEAQAIGRPVVTSNVEPMPEAAGGAACLVDPFNVLDIRRGIQAVLADPEYAKSLVSKGFENVKRFEPVRIAAQYAAIYRDIQCGRRPGKS